jgi:hypothetical protein
MRTRLNSYTGYSIGCAGVWGVILLLGRRRLDSQTRNTLWVACGGWWMGWMSATIARIGYPPPRRLTPAGEKRLRIVSIVLIALGLSSTIRMLATGKRPQRKRSRLLGRFEPAGSSAPRVARRSGSRRAVRRARAGPRAVRRGR